MKPYVWYSKDGKIYMTRCPKCNRENYAVCVPSGQCVWCKYVATDDDVFKYGDEAPK